MRRQRMVFRFLLAEGADVGPPSPQCVKSMQIANLADLGELIDHRNELLSAWQHEVASWSRTTGRSDHYRSHTATAHRAKHEFKI